MQNTNLLNKYNIESYPTLTIKENNKKFQQERTEENIKNFIYSSNYDIYFLNSFPHKLLLKQPHLRHLLLFLKH